MNSLLLRTLTLPRNSSLLAFSEYRDAELANSKHSSVNASGGLLEYETLELRVHPPNVEIDNDTYADRTLITLDSANRPGTLVEVVQLLTELGLNVIKARISSDGGWFVDEFHVTDAGRKVTNERKLRAIRKVLSVDADPADAEAAAASAAAAAAACSGLGPEGGAPLAAFDEATQCSTVFELAGNDRMGLLADVIALLKNNGCEVRSAAVWTYNNRCAFVISVLEGALALPIKDAIKLARLRQLLLLMMDPAGNCIVNVHTTKGLIHYERRLHQLLLREEEATWLQQASLAAEYERDIAEQQRMQERRWAGGASTASGGGSTGPASLTHSRDGSLGTNGALSSSGGGSSWLGLSRGPKSLGFNMWGGYSALHHSWGVSPAPSLPYPNSALPSPKGGTPGNVSPRPSVKVDGSSSVIAPASPQPSSSITPGHASGEVPPPDGMALCSAAGSTAAASEALAAAAADAANAALLATTLHSPDSTVHGAVLIASATGRTLLEANRSAGDGPAGSSPPAPASTGEPASSPRLTQASQPGDTTAAPSSASLPPGRTPFATHADEAITNGRPTSTSPPPPQLQPAASLAAPPSPAPPPAPSASASSMVRKPEVLVQHTRQHNYWTISIRCRDRQKLLFDTVCTLADLNYDVYHGAVDTEVERDAKTGSPVSIAVQTFYMRPRYGDSQLDPKRAAKLKYMLECAIQRRQPQGTKVHIQALQDNASVTTDLPALTAVWRDFGLCISRAKVRALAGTAGDHTFYLVDRQGKPPAETVVQAACQQIGGVRMARIDSMQAGGQGGGPAAAAGAGSQAGRGGVGQKSAGLVRNGDHKFAFTIQSRPVWGGAPGTSADSMAGSV